jgi:hypothetical protein
LRRAHAAIAALLILAAPAYAQSTPDAGSTLVLGSSQPAVPGSQTCVQVKVTGQTASPFNCLNQQLQQQVQGPAPAVPLPLGATSQSNAVGTFNRTGVAEQYGQNFGTSVTPYRPAPTISNGLHQ